MKNLKFFSILLVFTILLSTHIVQEGIGNQLQQSTSNQKFLTFKGDSNTYVLKKNITRGKIGLTNYNIIIKVIGMDFDSSRVTISKIAYKNTLTEILEQDFSLNSCYVSFLTKTVDSHIYWQNYAINNSYYKTDKEYRNISVNNEILTVASRNTNYGDWRCYVGNGLIKKWNWKTGWLEYYFLTDYNTDGSINYQFEYQVLKPREKTFIVELLFISLFFVAIYSGFEYRKYYKMKQQLNTKNKTSFGKFLRNKIIKQKQSKIITHPEKIIEKLVEIERENNPKK